MCTRRKKANRIGRNCLRKLITKKKDGRKYKPDRKKKKKIEQLLDDLEGKKKYWKLKEKTLDRTLENSLWKKLRTCHKADYVMMK